MPNFVKCFRKHLLQVLDYDKNLSKYYEQLIKVD